MPFLKLSTNVTIDQTQSEQLLTELLQLLAKETGKPERYVMVKRLVAKLCYSAAAISRWLIWNVKA